VVDALEDLDAGFRSLVRGLALPVLAGGWLLCLVLLVIVTGHHHLDNEHVVLLVVARECSEQQAPLLTEILKSQCPITLLDKLTTCWLLRMCAPFPTWSPCPRALEASAPLATAIRARVKGIRRIGTVSSPAQHARQRGEHARGQRCAVGRQRQEEAKREPCAPHLPVLVLFIDELVLQIVICQG
jgi:hypothetical protein